MVTQCSQEAGFVSGVLLLLFLLLALFSVACPQLQTFS